MGTESEPSQRPREALFDPVTGLPNSTLYEDRLEHSLVAAVRRNEVMAVGLISFGSRQAPGQLDVTLIRELGEALRDVLRASDTVAHLGRGRFGVVLNDAANAEGVRSAAIRAFLEIRQRLGASMPALSAAAGFGVSLPPHRGTAAILAEAEAAHLRAVERCWADPSDRDRDWAQVAIFEPGIDRAPDAAGRQPSAA